MKKVIFGLIAMVMFGNLSYGQTDESKGGPSPRGLGHFNVVSFLIDEGNNGCFRVHVVITYTDPDGTETVMVSDNVSVGPCKLSPQNLNSNCPDTEFKGDYFYSSKEDKRCIVDLLNDDEIYSLYSKEKERVLSQVDKK
jgi:hypothetical protein